MTLHVLNGGYGNDDQEFLERAAVGNGKAKVWTVPKGAEIDDDALINVAGQGLFATARIASATKLRTDKTGKRYGAALRNIQLLKRPIPIKQLHSLLPNFAWARYPRSITTPEPTIAERLRELVHLEATPTEEPSRSFEISSPSEIDDFANEELSAGKTPEQRLRNVYIRSARVRRSVLVRAKGICEGCGEPAPFKDRWGRPFLETHHIDKLAEDAKDSVGNVIGLCPNCHRRTDHAHDATQFNAMLRLNLKRILAKSRKAMSL